MARTIKLIDGPYAGVEVEVEGRSLLMEGDFPDGSGRSEPGEMANYRPTRANRDEFRFRGWSRDVLRIPLPGASNG